VGRVAELGALGHYARMKVFLWLLTLALILVCLTGWALSELVEHSMRDMHVAAPYFARLVILPHGWLFVAPMPWVVYAGFLTFRRELTPPALFLFAGTLVFFAALLICALALALVLPYIPLHA
jgi:hypothetical protein